MTIDVTDPREIPVTSRALAETRRSATRTETRALAKGATLSLRLASTERATIRAESGELWVTMEGDSADHVLRAGQTYRASGPGLLVIEGLTDSAEFEVAKTRHAPAWIQKCIRAAGFGRSGQHAG